MQLSHPTYLPLEPGQEVLTSGEILAYPAGRWPDKTGLICGERSWTFAELDRLANQFANALSEQFRDDGGPVGIIGLNCAEYAIAHFGTARSGRFSVNLPTRCTLEDLVYALEITAPAVIFADAVSYDMVQGALARLDRSPVLISLGSVGENDLWTFIEASPDTPPGNEINPDDPGSVIFTGGTTGRPKAVLSSQRARAISAMAAVEDFRVRNDYIAGYSVPFTHTAGLFSWFQPAVLAGCTGVIIPKWDPSEFMRLTELHGIGVIFAVPSQLVTLLDHPEFDAQRLESLKLIAFGGAPLPRSLIERAEQAMPWLECGRAFGSTETGHLAAQRKTDRDAVYDGYNNPGGRIEIEIFTRPGEPAEVGETGEVATRGPHLMTKYLEDDESCRSYFRSDDTDGDWGWMGDLAVKHEGYFSIVGRSKHMILSGGLNIYPAELEAVLIGHPAVSDCVVFGFDDDTWGELPAAAILADSGVASEEQILDYVAERVARYKRLRRLYFVEEIPRTAAGKAQVEVIREECLGRR